MKTQLDKVIFKYLDNQGFVQINKGKRIYFVNSEGDEYGIIRYDINKGRCYIKYKLIVEISNFFSLQDSDSQQVIGRWVENTLQTKVRNTERVKQLRHHWLRIPYKRRSETP